MNLSPEKTRREFVFDTSTLIILVEKCGLSDAFTRLAQKRKLYVPTRVVEEFLAGSNFDNHNATLRDYFIPLNVALADELLPYFNFKSTSGEIWVISYALRNPPCFCVIDEEFGRNICKLFSINVTGAVGIIDEMKRDGILSPSDLHCIRDKIRNTRFCLSKYLCGELDRICLT